MKREDILKDLMMSQYLSLGYRIKLFTWWHKIIKYEKSQYLSLGYRIKLSRYRNSLHKLRLSQYLSLGYRIKQKVEA